MGCLKCLPFLSGRVRGDQFYRYIGFNFTFGLLDCDRYIGDIVIPWIVKPGFCSIHYTVTLAGLKNVYRIYRRSLYRGSTVLHLMREFACEDPFKT